MWPPFFSSFLSFFSSPYTRTWPPFFSSFLSFFSSPANEGALKEIATATAMIANNMRFIICHLPWFVKCALQRALSEFEQAWCPRRLRGCLQTNQCLRLKLTPEIPPESVIFTVAE